MEQANNYVYLDYAATAPLCEEAREALLPFLDAGACGIAQQANANSLHTPGRKAFETMEKARKHLSQALGAQRPSELVFTSGATEADNAALFGMAKAASEQRHYAAKQSGSLGHVIVSSIEHEAVLQPAHELQRMGYEVSFVAPNASGIVETERLEALMQDNTLLVSVMMANSEIGSIAPIQELARCAHEHHALFHTDATQALGKTPCVVSELGVDAASFSAHKIGGLKGVGVLYLKARTPFVPLLYGGGQEEGRRSTTQNVAGIVSFAAAAQAAVEHEAAESLRLRTLRDYLYEQLAALKNVRITLDIPKESTHYLPNIVHFLVPGIESETLILRLDREGFGVSGGSACSSHSLDPSHVLRAIGVKSDDAYCALRVSMGRYTTKEQIDAFLLALQKVIS